MTGGDCAGGAVPAAAAATVANWGGTVPTLLTTTGGGAGAVTCVPVNFDVAPIGVALGFAGGLVSP